MVHLQSVSFPCTGVYRIILRPREAVRLKRVGGIALPKNFSSFLDDILGQIPASPIPVHTHLCAIISDLPPNIKSLAYRLSQSHHQTPQRPSTVATTTFITVTNSMSAAREEIPGLAYVQVQMCHQMLSLLVKVMVTQDSNLRVFGVRQRCYLIGNLPLPRLVQIDVAIPPPTGRSWASRY